MLFLGTLTYCPTSCVDPPLDLVKKLSLSDGVTISPSTSDLKVVQLADNEGKHQFGTMITESSVDKPFVSNDETVITTEKVDCTGNGYFDTLPMEVIDYIFSFLPLPDLCNSAKVCRFFHNLSYDPSRYTHVNLSSYWSIVNDEALYSLQCRCGKQNSLKYFGEDFGNLQVNKYR